ncbi:MAG: UDP-N-acetylglucosamine--N-acetylmuramyl-(pentapeptide) pyrophosphoryl-undecaprenol N-acetylglucosamine transferase, partial [Patescibacteria group bacterium]
MRIVFSGGGTAGPVTPLLAVAKHIREKVAMDDFLWLGTFSGPEKKLVTSASIRFLPIFSGKLRRYFHWRNIIDPLFVVVGFAQSLYILHRFKPDVVVSAGAFVSVPVAWAAKMLRIPVI